MLSFSCARGTLYYFFALFPDQFLKVATRILFQDTICEALQARRLGLNDVHRTERAGGIASRDRCESCEAGFRVEVSGSTTKGSEGLGAPS